MISVYIAIIILVAIWNTTIVFSDNFEKEKCLVFWNKTNWGYYFYIGYNPYKNIVGLAAKTEGYSEKFSLYLLPGLSLNVISINSNKRYVSSNEESYPDGIHAADIIGKVGTDNMVQYIDMVEGLDYTITEGKDD